MTEMKRRIFLKGSLAAGAVGFAVGAGLMTPRAVLAKWSADAFGAKKIPAALKGLYGSDTTEVSDAIKIKAPDIAENGTPLVADFQLSAESVPFVSTRIKMGKTGDVVAVVKAGGKLHSARKSVKVTIGGCGG